ncbi:hypothetical protein GCM10010994_60630 [Chelatococcus reniformis]|uniref:Uncharacterized protein n=1 Tax=Chelatococcus reniformis TaxID=1494448 RepID=A0A916XS16_9HYPH|nr:hypothetical protein GCM10010994_60630 [Chelatococcus reniformis]
MFWIRLTKVDGTLIHVNMSTIMHFSKIGEGRTRLSSIASKGEIVRTIDVREPPEKIGNLLLHIGASVYTDL